MLLSFIVLHLRYLENQCREVAVVIANKPAVFAVVTWCITVKKKKLHIDNIYNFYKDYFMKFFQTYRNYI